MATYVLSENKWLIPRILKYPYVWRSTFGFDKSILKIFCTDMKFVLLNKKQWIPCLRGYYFILPYWTKKIKNKNK